jgi:hypothetical protein
MSKIEDLCEKHKKEIEDLQRECKHEKISNWMDEWWAPGHSTGRSVQCCEDCNKIVHSQTPCTGSFFHSCQNIIFDGAGYKHIGLYHDGDPEPHYASGLYCHECEIKIKSTTQNN